MKRPCHHQVTVPSFPSGYRQGCPPHHADIYNHNEPHNVNFHAKSMSQILDPYTYKRTHHDPYQKHDSYQGLALTHNHHGRGVPYYKFYHQGAPHKQGPYSQEVPSYPNGHHYAAYPSSEGYRSGPNMVMKWVSRCSMEIVD